MSTDQKPFAPACERNQEPIRATLAALLPEPSRVLEIGSGTGQHGVYLCRHLPHLQWQPTDLPEALPGLAQWVDESGLDNLSRPRALDVTAPPADITAAYDAVFTANTLHYVSWPVLQSLLECSAVALRHGGQLLAYGPFNHNGEYSSDGNRSLDAWLKERDPEIGIKDLQSVAAMALDMGLDLVAQHPMPANNQILQFFRRERS
ncbi:MAG: DUF938 domain-containing protein [Oleiphilaceae bacterium]|nr:DUF938 domain-containing protein [Oleiphilaceae bacterium]